MTEREMVAEIRRFRKESKELEIQLKKQQEINKKAIGDNKIQQQEFIKWLKAMSKMYEEEYKDIDIAEHYNCVLQKYLETIGEK